MTRTTVLFTAGIACLTCLPANLHAQDIAAITEEIAAEANTSAQEQELPESAIFSLRSDTGDATFGAVPKQVLFRSAIEGESVQLTISDSVSTWNDFGQADLSLTLTAPFSKKDKIGSFITETGLPNTWSIGTTLSISLVETPQADPLQIAEDLTMQVISMRSACESKNATLAEAEQIKCEDVGIQGLISHLDSDPMAAVLQQQVNALTAQMQDASYLGLQASFAVGLESFDFRNPADYAELDKDHMTFSASTSLIYMPHLSSPFALITGAEVEREYKLPDAEIRCPVGAAPMAQVTCFEAAYGPPVRNTDATLFAAARYSNDLFGLPIGAELRFAVNPEDGEWGVEAPIYLFRDKDGNLNGGVRVGYDSEEDDAFFGVFIGSNFNFLQDSE